LQFLPSGQQVPLGHREFIGQHVPRLSHACDVGQQTLLQTVVSQHALFTQLAVVFTQHTPLHVLLLGQHISFLSQ
jgi:hypothetical protein